MRSLSSEQKKWVQSHLQLLDVIPLVGDAGFRRYFRLLTPETSYIFMDASEEPAIYDAFLSQSRHLASSSFPIPRIFFEAKENAWAILEDFGDRLLFEIFGAQKDAFSLADNYYRQAMDHLLVLHAYPVKAFGRLSVLDAEAIEEELLGWQTWFLEGLFKQTACVDLNNCYNAIIRMVTQQPYVFIHRDFHSRNILKKPDGKVGIIDYQDAMYGPITYDLASLLRDCYVDWPEQQVVTWVLYYKQRAQAVGLLEKHVSDETFLAWFDWTSVQRHLKALFTFARKSLRDQNTYYLQFIPRTLRYLERITACYAELTPLCCIIQKITISDQL